MADDLDRLLDEVERRLSRLPGRGVAGGHQHGDGDEEDEKEAAASKEGRSAKLLMSTGSSEEDIDDIIDEICNESSFAKTPLKLKSNSASLTPESNSAVVQAHRKRCCPVYLGGSSSPYGIGTNISKRTCDQLRCTACDFRVLLFNDYIWDQSCDYLFFSKVSVRARYLMEVVDVFRVCAWPPGGATAGVEQGWIHHLLFHYFACFTSVSLEADTVSLNPTENIVYKNVNLQLIGEYRNYVLRLLSGKDYVQNRI